MSLFFRKFFVMFLPLTAFGGETDYWLIHETNLWFNIATSPTIVVGKLTTSEKADALETDSDEIRDGNPSTLLVEEVIKGPKNLNVLSISQKANLPMAMDVPTNLPSIFFFSYTMEPKDGHHLGETSDSPSFVAPSTPDIIHEIKTEVLTQTSETAHFQETVSLLDLPADDQLQKTFSNIILHQAETDDIEWLCGIDIHKVPGLLCLITNDIPIKPTTLSFVNSSSNAFEPIAHYEVSSTVGLVSVIADRCLGTGIFSAYCDETLADRRHMQNMWEVFVLRWLGQSRQSGRLLRPVIGFVNTKDP